MPQGFGERTYQQWVHADGSLCSFQVTVRETDLLIRAEADLSHVARQSIVRHRTQIEQYLHSHPDFQTALSPLEADSAAPPIIQEMARAATRVGVGPFASVAGVMAEYVGRDLLQHLAESAQHVSESVQTSSEVIVENGGDIFIASNQPRILGIYAGNSPLTGKLGIRLEPAQMPCGVCTSSATIGHSLSFGRTDAAIVISKSTALADACATALGNNVSDSADIPEGLAFAEQIDGIDGAIVILGDKIGIWGNVQLVKTTLGSAEPQGTSLY
jgi:ApbE superfamily uncharacterized protein (UPF0280 family)